MFQNIQHLAQLIVIASLLVRDKPLEAPASGETSLFSHLDDTGSFSLYWYDTL